MKRKTFLNSIAMTAALPFLSLEEFILKAEPIQTNRIINTDYFDNSTWNPGTVLNIRNPDINKPYVWEMDAFTGELTVMGWCLEYSQNNSSGYSEVLFKMHFKPELVKGGKLTINIGTTDRYFGVNLDTKKKPVLGQTFWVNGASVNWYTLTDTGNGFWTIVLCGDPVQEEFRKRNAYFPTSYSGIAQAKI